MVSFSLIKALNIYIYGRKKSGCRARRLVRTIHNIRPFFLFTYSRASCVYFRLSLVYSFATNVELPVQPAKFVHKSARLIKKEETPFLVRCTHIYERDIKDVRNVRKRTVPFVRDCAADVISEHTSRTGRESTN